MKFMAEQLSKQKEENKENFRKQEENSRKTNEENKENMEKENSPYKRRNGNEERWIN